MNQHHGSGIKDTHAVVRHFPRTTPRRQEWPQDIKQARKGLCRVMTVNRDLEKVAERLDRLTDAMVDGLIDKDAFNGRKASLLEERQRLNARRTEGNPATFWAMTLARFEQANAAQQSYISGTNPEKRDLLISLGSNISVHGRETEFSTDFPFSQIIKWRSHVNGGP